MSSNFESFRYFVFLGLSKEEFFREKSLRKKFSERVNERDRILMHILTIFCRYFKEKLKFFRKIDSKIKISFFIKGPFFTIFKEK
jgi:hypothetical protein